MKKRYEVKVQHGSHGGGSSQHFHDREDAIRAARKAAQDGYRNETHAAVWDHSAGGRGTVIASFYDENGQIIQG